MKFRFGIEHEVAFVRRDGTFADFSNTNYEEFAAIVAQLPEYPSDQACLRMGDAGIRRKRWYIEGIERFDETGNLLQCIPKGIEIRTTVHENIAATLAELETSFAELTSMARQFGFSPIATSFNPLRTEFIPNPPLNAYELERMAQSPEDQTEHLPMLTYGPDLNLSVIGASTAQTIDWAKKLTYYSPYLVPFSYCEGLYGGKIWPGKSVRTFHRTGLRPAVLVFVQDQADVIDCEPSLVKWTPKFGEWGRIEFKAFDSCANFDRYGELFVLLKGVLLDHSLKGRAIVPDLALHQHSAQLGWDSPQIYQGSCQILEAATHALKTFTLMEQNDRLALENLAQMLKCPV